MLIVNLDGAELCWKPRGRQSLFDKGSSSPHKTCRQILKEKHPTIRILEEVSIPVRNKKTLFLDFYIPLLNTAIEVQGEQHYKFTSGFHKTKGDFLRQKKNDKEKSEWCELNNIRLITLRFDEVEKWSSQF